MPSPVIGLTSPAASPASSTGPSGWRQRQLLSGRWWPRQPRARRRRRRGPAPRAARAAAAGSGCSRPSPSPGSSSPYPTLARPSPRSKAQAYDGWRRSPYRISWRPGAPAWSARSRGSRWRAARGARRGGPCGRGSARRRRRPPRPPRGRRHGDRTAVGGGRDRGDPVPAQRRPGGDGALDEAGVEDLRAGRRAPGAPSPPPPARRRGRARGRAAASSRPRRRRRRRWPGRRARAARCRRRRTCPGEVAAVEQQHPQRRVLREGAQRGRRARGPGSDHDDVPRLALTGRSSGRTGSRRSSLLGPGAVPISPDDVQGARAVDALDPVELDVAGGARPADPGERPGGSSSATASGTSATTWSARTTHTCRSGTRLIARRPWSGPWSSTMVPVSAMPTRAAVTTASMPSSRGRTAGGAGRRRRRRPGTSRPSPAGTTALPPASSGGHRGRDLVGRAAGHHGAVVLDPLDEQADQVVDRSHGRRRPGSGPAGSTPSRAARTRPGSRRGRCVIVVLRRCASTRRGTTPRAVRAGRAPTVQAPPGPGSRPAARRPPGSVVRPKRPSTRPARPDALSAQASRRASEKAQAAAFIAAASGLGTASPRWLSTTWARRSTSTDGMSMRTGQTSKQAPHSDDA